MLEFKSKATTPIKKTEMRYPSCWFWQTAFGFDTKFQVNKQTGRHQTIKILSKIRQ